MSNASTVNDSAPADEWAASPRRFLLYVAVGLVAGAVIALQIAIMRVFSVGSWAHFGSLVVSLAMLGFGLTSAVMCVAKGWFERHWQGVIAGALALFGPLVVASNLAAQQLPFNAIFLISDPMQKWRLFANFALYLLPFLAGATFLGTVFLRAQRVFGRVYFADLAGSGLCGLLFLGAMFFLRPENLVVVPVVLAGLGGVLWFTGLHRARAAAGVALIALVAAIAHFTLPSALGIPKLAVSDYKGVSYARKFPDNQRVYERASPFGYIEVYSSSYLHFAPGLSDNAALNLAEMPANAYLGLYLDSDGPSGIIRDLSAKDSAYFRYLPMSYPYLIKPDADSFIVQFGGGISTAVALKSGARHVTVAESNPAVLDAFQNDPKLREFTGDVLKNPKVSVVDHDGRLFLAHTSNRYDVIDLSLADSAGLSSPGGFAIVEKYAYTREAMANYMRALKPGGVLAVTLWNKEEPPKSVLKLYTTMVEAARLAGEEKLADSFFVASSYLSTATVLYQRGGFDAATIAKLREHTSNLSFDEIYSPGYVFDVHAADKVLDGYREQLFGDGETKPSAPKPATANAQADASIPADEAGTADASIPADESGTEPSDDAPGDGTVPATTLARAAWQALIHPESVAGGWDAMAQRYVFDSRALSNAHPYFAAYLRPGDLPRVTDRLELLQEEWGYLLLWATLAIACIAGLVLILIPLVFGWRTIFNRTPGKFLGIVYFACLGLGYIMVEVGLIAHFMLALSNATVSAAVLITGMLVFSGLGSFVSERFLSRAKRVMPRVFLAIGAILIFYGFFLDRALDPIGMLPYAWRLVCCFALIAPPAFLMGFPMPMAMTSLALLKKDHMFLWAWGVNGCFSVIGAAVVPLIATAYGLTAVLVVAGVAYLIAIPAFFAVLKPLRAQAPA